MNGLPEDCPVRTSTIVPSWDTTMANWAELAELTVAACNSAARLWREALSRSRVAHSTRSRGCCVAISLAEVCATAGV